MWLRSLILLAWSVPAIAGTATLTWTPPTTRTDGSALTDLAGYRLYERCGAGSYGAPISIPAPASSYARAPLPDGATCYWQLTAVDAAGRESARTAEVSKTFPLTELEQSSGFSVTWQATAEPPTGPPEMALVRTTRLAATSGTSFGTGAYTPASFTPANNSLLVIRVSAIDNNDGTYQGSNITLTNSAGLTLTPQVATADPPDWGYGIRVWTAPVTTGASMTVTADSGGDNIYAYRVEVYEYTSDAGGTLGVGATAAGVSSDGDGPETITLSAAPASSSEVLAFLGVGMSNGNHQATEGTGWTEISDTFTSDWMGYQTQVRGGSTSDQVSWQDILTAGTTFGGAVMCAIEITETVSGGTEISANTDALVITEPVASIDLSSDASISANTDALVITERVGVIGLARSIAASAAALYISGRSLAGSVHYALNGAGDYDYGVLEALPAGFGDGEFTLEIRVRATDTSNVGQTSSGAGVYTNWATENETPYSASDWWFYGNFLLDGHNNSAYESGTFSLQVFNSGRIRWTFGDGAAAGARTGDLHAVQSASGASILDGEWHKIACVRRWDGGTGSILELYVDGVQQDTETSTARTNMASTYWDSWSGYPTNQDGWFFGAEKQAALGSIEWADFKGRVCDLAFWSIARSESELTTNWNVSPVGTETGLVGVYRHDEGSGTSVADELGSGGDITLNNPDAGVWSSDAPSTGSRATISLSSGIAAAFDSLGITELAGTVNAANAIAAAFDTIAITEQTSAVSLAQAIAAQVDTLNLTELSAAISRVFTVAAAIDTLAITENVASVAQGSVVNALTDSLVISEQEASLNYARAILAITDSLLISELAATISQGSAIGAAADTLTLAEYAASIGAATEVAANVAALVLAEAQANVGLARNLAAAAGSLSISEQAAAIGLGLAIAAEFDALTIEEKQAAVSGTSAIINVSAGRLIRLAASRRTVKVPGSSRTVNLN